MRNTIEDSGVEEEFLVRRDMDGQVLASKRRRIVKMVSFVLFAVIALYGLSMTYSVGINISESISPRVLLVKKGVMPERGEIAAFRPPANPHHNTYQFFKYVSGVAGDVVERDGLSFSVAGHFVGVAKTQTSKGEPLEATPAGVIPPNHYFMSGTHPDSYDSRYKEIGLVPKENIIGRAIVLVE